MTQGIIFALLFLSCSSSLKVAKSDLIYSEALKYIIDDSSLVEKNKVYVSEEVISFNTISVLPDLISKKYIKGFSIFHITNDQQQIVNRLTDSLQDLDKMLNLDYKPRDVIRITNSIKGVPDFILFFTDIRSNKLYAELLPYNEKVFKDKKRETIAYGKANSFLFILNSENKIERVYKGSINFN